MDWSLLGGTGLGAVLVGLVSAWLSWRSSRDSSDLAEDKQSFEIMQAALARLDQDVASLRSEVERLKRELEEVSREKRLLSERYSLLWVFARGLVEKLRGHGVDVVVPEPLKADYVTLNTDQKFDMVKRDHVTYGYGREGR